GDDGDGEVGLLDAVGELKDDAERHAAGERRQRVYPEHRPPGVQQHGDAEGDREEHDFAGDEYDQVLALGPRDRVAADAAHRDVVEVVEEVPLDGEETVQDPKVDALEAVEPVALLMRPEAAEEPDIDVVVLAFD